MSEKMTIDDKIEYLHGLNDAIKEIADKVRFYNEYYPGDENPTTRIKALNDAVAAIEKLAEVF